MSLQERRQRRCAALCIVLVAAGGAARAQLLDARGMAMGGVALPGSPGFVTRVNPGYRAVPDRSLHAARVVTLPLGLVQTAADFPTLDPDSADPDLAALARLCANLPWALAVPRGDDGLAGHPVRLGADSSAVVLSDLQNAIALADLHVGSVGRLLDAGLTLDLGARKGVVQLALLQPFVRNELRIELDPALRSLLAAPGPVAAATTARLRLDGTLQAWLSSGITYARELPLPVPRLVAAVGTDSGNTDGNDWMERYWDADRDRVRAWAGVAYRRLFGIAQAGLQGELALTPRGAARSGDAVLDLGYDARYTTASPGLDLDSGQAVDAGVVVRWRTLEIGAGVADLLADLSFDGARRDHYVHDVAARRTTHEVLATDQRVTSDIPASWLVNASWELGGWLIAADARHEPGGTGWHLGAERWTRAGVALRGGLELDQRDALQGGAGIGLRSLGGSRLGLDLGLLTQSRTVSGERVLSVGIALVLQ